MDTSLKAPAKKNLLVKNPVIRHDLLERIESMKVIHVVNKNKLSKKQLRESQIEFLKKQQQGKKKLNTSSSLPHIQSNLRNLQVQNSEDQTLNSPSLSMSRKGVDSDKTWLFVPTIQEQFKINLIQHKKQFELIE